MAEDWWWGMRVSLAQWCDGIIAVHPARNPKYLRNVLNQHGWDEEVKEACIDTYVGMMKRTRFAGYCSVHRLDFPWIIVIVATTDKDMMSIFIHELLHLCEHLPLLKGVHLSRETEEVRATLAQTVFDQVYPQLCKLG